eukprot:CAMPEP_0119105376 /NCGR_PEP_ID=MMETSP1180-20130426/3351_1 /TAXON_ID=3052 ORGANISM="Chlamydomonas cf sp, Strain CCMP681" /NCGR_SAMPLE_ID=MMETSP1180 /ASSEMBLY_ACC=CAM_ASM_000741 /LENGTH=286 /DNA_ID=CAMNT_0007090407 /DNA_START=149 /DNA_END=1009 /DNA_ORIENTATION=+
MARTASLTTKLLLVVCLALYAAGVDSRLLSGQHNAGSGSLAASSWFEKAAGSRQVNAESIKSLVQDLQGVDEHSISHTVDEESNSEESSSEESSFEESSFEESSSEESSSEESSSEESSSEESSFDESSCEESSSEESSPEESSPKEPSPEQPSPEQPSPDAPSAGISGPEEPSVVQAPEVPPPEFISGGPTPSLINDPEVLTAAAQAIILLNADEPTRTSSLGAGVGVLQLVAVKSADKQVVAGTLFVMVLSVRETSGRAFDIDVSAWFQAWATPAWALVDAQLA